MKRLELILVICVTSLGGVAHADSEMAESKGRSDSGVLKKVIQPYRSVHELTQAPLQESGLVVSCEAKLGERYVTFLGYEANSPLVAAFTKHRLRNPSADVILHELYVMKRGLPHPIGYDPRSETPTMDWAYILDRNGDGHVEYLAYLESPMAVKPPDHEGNLPPIIGAISGATDAGRGQLHDSGRRNSAWRRRHGDWSG